MLWYIILGKSESIHCASIANAYQGSKLSSILYTKMTEKRQLELAEAQASACFGSLLDPVAAMVKVLDYQVQGLIARWIPVDFLPLSSKHTSNNN